MTSAYSSTAGSRRMTVLTAIAGLHVGLYLAIVNGLQLRSLAIFDDQPPPITLIPEPKEPIEIIRPGTPEPLAGVFAKVEAPIVELPPFHRPEEASASGASTADRIAGSSGGAAPG